MAINGCVSLGVQIMSLMSHGMTQRGIAEYIGVSQSCISHVLCGRQKDLRYSAAAKLFELHKLKITECNFVCDQ